ncbi:glycosyltransferase family 2 protein, partial [Solemya elarraichensis gill symbiont]
MLASVILTTYNQPSWLDKCLTGFTTQTYRQFEVIVADDGSTDDTRDVIERIRTETEIPIQHIWQPDEGFRKCRILNKAILASQSDYTIFTDGDCIPHPDFVKNHVALAEENTFLSGGSIHLPIEISNLISKEDILLGHSTNPRWLLRNGFPYTPKILKLYSHPYWGSVLDFITTTRATWKKYLVAANGYNEEMQYGGLDRELGERLINMGLNAKQIRHRACCSHLEHDRHYVNQESILLNRQIREEIKRKKIQRTTYGLD